MTLTKNIKYKPEAYRLTDVDNNMSTKCVVIKLFIFFFLIYLLTASAQNFYKYESSQIHLAVTRSIVENFDFSVPAGQGLRGADGRDYSWLGLGYPLFAIPFYLLNKLVGGMPGFAISLINQIFGALTAVLVFLFSLHLGYSKRASFLTSLFYGLGTFAWPYTKQPFDNVLETFFLLLSIFNMHLFYDRGKTKSLLISASCLGFAFLTRPTSVLAIPSIFILLILHRTVKTGFKEYAGVLMRDVGLFSMTFLPFLLVSFWYNYYRFGSIFETGYTLIASQTRLDFFSGTPILTGLYGFLASPGKGFFYYSPVAVLFLFSINLFRKRNPAAAVSFISIMLCYLIFLSKNIFWHGDWAWGPRYLLAITPFVIVPIAAILDSDVFLNKNLAKGFIWHVFLISVVIQILAVSVEPNKYFHDLREKNIKFVELRVSGVQPIIEPNPEAYFDWKLSPLISQFKFFVGIVKNMNEFSYGDTATKPIYLHTKKPDPSMNLIDIWWIYKYYIENTICGFYAAFLLFLAISNTFIRLLKCITVR